MKFLVALSLFVAIATAASEQKTWQIEPRIFNGENAELGQFPWHVGIGYSDYWPVCGGALIHTNFVFTAAHCISDDDEAYYLIFGITNLKEQEPVKRVVTKWVIHKEFNPKFAHNDVALLYIEDKVEQTENIKTIRIGWTRLQENEVITISGWGRLGEGKDYPVDLKFIELTTIKNENCLWINPALKESAFCCRAKDKSTCSGDSGGPAVQFKEGEETLLVGILSFGSSAGCESGHPVGFSRTEDFYEWVLKSMEELWA